MSTTDVLVPPRRFQLSPRQRWWFDALLWLALVGLAALMGLAGGSLRWLLLGLAQTIPLWWRRSHPIAVYTAVALASAAQVPLIAVPLTSQLAYPVAMYSLARFSTAVPSWIGLGVGLIASGVAGWDWTRSVQADPTGAAISQGVLIAMIVVAAWALGTLGRIRAAYVAALVARAEHLARESEQQAELAASDERARIAREMHDVVAHGLSVIIVQADGARYAAAKDPQVAISALDTVAATGRDSLAEMRRLLGLLRSDDTGTRPQPSLPDLPWLLEQAAADGLPVDVSLPDPLPGVSEGVGLVAYRIVQEALTNVRRHAGVVRRVSVAVRLDGAALAIEISDDGRGAGTSTTGSGLGLVGMRERVAAAGGSVRTGALPGGGFGVSARIPL